MKKLIPIILLALLATNLEAKPRDPLPDSYAVLPPATQPAAPVYPLYDYVMFRLWSVVYWQF